MKQTTKKHLKENGRLALAQAYLDTTNGRKAFKSAWIDLCTNHPHTSQIVHHHGEKVIRELAESCVKSHS